jgi:hypothetical protein
MAVPSTDVPARQYWEEQVGRAHLVVKPELLKIGVEMLMNHLKQETQVGNQGTVEREAAAQIWR